MKLQNDIYDFLLVRFISSLYSLNPVLLFSQSIDSFSSFALLNSFRTLVHRVFSSFDYHFGCSFLPGYISGQFSVILSTISSVLSLALTLFSADLILDSILKQNMSHWVLRRFLREMVCSSRFFFNDNPTMIQKRIAAT